MGPAAGWALAKVGGNRYPAIASLEEALETCPNDGDGSEIQERIIAELLQLLPRGTRHAELQRRSAGILEQGGSRERALEAYDAAGDEFLGSEDYVEAESCYRAALDLAPDSFRGLLFDKIIRVMAMARETGTGP